MNPWQFARWHISLAERLRPTLLRGARSGAARVVALMVERTRKARGATPGTQASRGGAVNTGEFIRAWRWLPLPDGARVLNDRPYGAVIEYGRRPGSKPPPTSVIYWWLIRRLRWTPEKAGARAWIVAQSIGRRGLMPRLILTAPEAQMQIEDLVHQEVMHELTRELNRGI